MLRILIFTLKTINLLMWSETLLQITLWAAKLNSKQKAWQVIAFEKQFPNAFPLALELCIRIVPNLNVLVHNVLLNLFI